MRTSPEEYERIQNAVNPADSEGRTPLHRAAEEGSSLGVHRLLEEGADPNVPDTEGWTPLDRAAESIDGAGAVERLLAEGANPHCAAGQDQQTPLHRAAGSDSPESVNHLLKANARPGVADSEGRTPLHYAAANGSPEITARLLEAGADPNVPDNAGRTPLDVAADRRDRLDPSSRNDEAGAAPREGEPTPTGQHTGEGAAHAAKDKHRRVLQAVCRRHHHADRCVAPPPWQKHWQPGENRMPENFSTGARYQGGNALQLMVKRTHRAWNDHRWGTYNQIKRSRGAGTER